MDFNFKQYIKTLPKLVEAMEQNTNALNGLLNQAEGQVTQKQLDEIMALKDEMDEGINEATSNLDQVGIIMNKTHRK